MEPTLNPESGFLRLRIDFSYDGTGFSGWAKQSIAARFKENLKPRSKE